MRGGRVAAWLPAERWWPYGMVLHSLAWRPGLDPPAAGTQIMPGRAGLGADSRGRRCWWRRDRAGAVGAGVHPVQGGRKNDPRLPGLIG
ncbi:hypothetical protein ACTI_01580 [Actinoplanes sp. OR16]|nr:hypothetical protein ACTI_01580 [Actinoplanes sp. OR16]